MPVQDIIKDAGSAMVKAIEHAGQHISKVRTGRASVTLLDNVKVEYYGTPTALSQVGSLSVPDARTILIQPWDKGTLSAIEKGVLIAGLGLNPSNDGSVIRVPIPPLTEERRKEFVKLCKKFSEDGRVAIRNIRRDHMEALKVAEKKEHFSEDDRKRGEDEIQKLTDKYIKEIDAIMVKKEKEILED